MRPPELSSTQSRYCVAAATAFQVKVGVVVAMLPDGVTSVAAPGGTALLTVNVSAPEVPPPGVGEKTVTDAVPAVAMSPAVIAACNWVLLTNVVTRAPLVHCTTDPLTKFVPFTVRVKAAAPAVALPGVSEPSVGTELLMVNVSAPEVPPPGVGENTVTDAVPAVAASLAGIAARNCVPLTNVVVRAAPFQRTTDPLTKFVPFTVRVKAAAPAVALPGVSEPIVGTGLLMVNVSAPEVPPPGVGENTVTDAVPAVATSLAGIAACNWVPLTNVVVRAPPFQRTTDPLT